MTNFLSPKCLIPEAGDPRPLASVQISSYTFFIRKYLQSGYNCTCIHFFHLTVVSKPFLIPKGIRQGGKFRTDIPVGNTDIIPIRMFSYNQVKMAPSCVKFCLTGITAFYDL